MREAVHGVGRERVRRGPRNGANGRNAAHTSPQLAGMATRRPGSVADLGDRKFRHEEFAISATDIGHGNFSRVQKARHRVTGEFFALKEIEKAKVQRLARRHPNIRKEIIMEKDLLSTLSHPGVVRLFGTFQVRASRLGFDSDASTSASRTRPDPRSPPFSPAVGAGAVLPV